MQICQSEQYIDDNWWQWSVWLDAPPEKLDAVESVEWRLHPSFPNPVRRVTDRSTKFRLETGGWGVFMIHASVQLKDGTTERLRHYLELRLPDGTPNTA